MAKIILSAQNFDIYDGDGFNQFARTGAISVEHLFKAGAVGVIIGHSEVGDSPTVIRKKLLTIIKKREQHSSSFILKSTVLIGESWKEFEGSSKEKVADIIGLQLKSILKDLPQEFVSEFVLGYEPKWGSRGSGRDDMPPPTPEFISSVIKSMKEQLKNDFGQKIAQKVPLIYGGRSTPERAAQILIDKNITGLILGSAGNTIEKTLTIAQTMKKCKLDSEKVLHVNFKAYNLADSYEDYINALKNLDDSFKIYISPPYTDIYLLKTLL